jgi:hypothetical protein
MRYFGATGMRRKALSLNRLEIARKAALVRPAVTID